MYRLLTFGLKPKYGNMPYSIDGTGLRKIVVLSLGGLLCTVKVVGLRSVLDNDVRHVWRGGFRVKTRLAR